MADNNKRNSRAIPRRFLMTQYWFVVISDFSDFSENYKY
jgi:hypothetical protein